MSEPHFMQKGFAEKGRLFGEMRDKSCFVNHPCGQSETDHPNEKPVSVVLKLIRLGTLPGETVADPFMGSGTTGIACIRTGRKFIGIEKDPTHFQTAVDRIKRELAQPQLFKPEPPQHRAQELAL